MLRITPEVRDQMFAHAIAGLPNEACGMGSVLNGSQVIDIFHPMRNAAASPMIFLLDGQEMLDLERRVDEANRDLVAVMHSHTESSPYPSPTDVRDSNTFDPSGVFHHLIVSLRDAEPVLRCFTIVGDEISEVPVVVAEDDGDLHDQGGAVAAVMSLPPRS